MAGPIVCEQSNLVAVNEYVSVFMDDVVFPDGITGTHLRVDEPTGGAAVLVVDGNGRIYLHKVFRYATGQEHLEIIRGFGDSEDKSLMETAMRELQEECGFAFEVTEDPVELGYVYANSSLLSSRVLLVFVCVHPTRKKVTDGMERPHGGSWVTVGELLTLVASGEMEDGFTMAALLRAVSLGLVVF